MSQIQSAFVGVAAGNISGTVGVTQGGTGVSAAGGQLAWLPSDQGLLAVNGDTTAMSQTTSVITAGSQYLLRVNIRAAITASTVWVNINAAGSGASTGTFCGLINSAGTLLTGSADCATQFTGTGAQSISLTSPQALAAGTFVWVAILSNLAVSQPGFRGWAAQTSTISDFNQTAANFRVAINGTVITALQSVTPSANTATGTHIWVGLS
jgi:hypothetical protein